MPQFGDSLLSHLPSYDNVEHLGYGWRYVSASVLSDSTQFKSWPGNLVKFVHLNVLYNQVQSFMYKIKVAAQFSYFRSSFAN
jgi:hypothetical protein